MRKAAYHLALLSVVALCGVLVADPGEKPVSATSAQSKPAANKPAANKLLATKSGKNRPGPSITPEREAAVATFVERNHPELSDLLAHLKLAQPKQYEQAVKEIYRVTERLAGVQERDTLHYELEVKLWTAQSRTQLLAARLKMGESETLKSELRQSLAQQSIARLDVLKHQREQAAGRLEKMDREIKRIEEDQMALIERQLETLTRAAAKTNKKKPAK